MKNINLTSKGVVVDIKEVCQTPEELDRIIECISECKEALIDYQKRLAEQNLWENHHDY